MLTNQILSHFKKNDKLIHDLLQSHPIEPLTPRFSADRYFYRLATDIIGQQLSVKVADVITQRFDALFVDQISPKAVLNIADQTYRDIGMSWAKVKYVKDLAQKTLDGEIEFATIEKLTDEQVIEHLTKIKGIGRWTAEMFLIFTLGREDVFSFGDLGLRRAIEKIYELPKNVDQKEFSHLVEKWTPYRSYASLALWRSLDNK